MFFLSRIAPHPRSASGARETGDFLGEGVQIYRTFVGVVIESGMSLCKYLFGSIKFLFFISSVLLKPF